jgi:uncharacterized protein (TIGR02646 family)
MRRVQLPKLPKRVHDYLQRKHDTLVQQKKDHSLDVETLWKKSRQTKNIKEACKLLQQVMGPRERCMYCLDSHGTDIEHFRPKARYPLQTFQWSNWLICCTECGRMKGHQFPIQNRRPLLVNPTAENPWDFLDFDPDTGNLTARFDLVANNWSAKGAETVRVLHLDTREALAAGYRRTYLNLVEVVNKSLATAIPADAAELVENLKNKDEHGLLEWCFCFTGQFLSPFSEIKKRHPTLWDDCKRMI